MATEATSQNYKVFFKLGSFETELPCQGAKKPNKCQELFSKNRDIVYLFVSITAALFAVLLAYRVIPTSSIERLYFKVGVLAAASLVYFCIAVRFSCHDRGCIIVRKVIRSEELENPDSTPEYSSAHQEDI